MAPADDQPRYVVRTPEVPLIRALVLGPRGAGKTTLMRGLSVSGTNTSAPAIPVIGLDVETSSCPGVVLTCWGFGGGCEKTRPLWRHCYEGTDVVIFVVDSSDRASFGNASDALERALAEEQLRHCRVVVVANKQDLQGALCASEVAAELGLSRIRQQWSILEASATTGAGLSTLACCIAGTAHEEVSAGPCAAPPPITDSPPEQCADVPSSERDQVPAQRRRRLSLPQGFLASRRKWFGDLKPSVDAKPTARRRFGFGSKRTSETSVDSWQQLGITGPVTRWTLRSMAVPLI